jgi:hypothetical protein
VKIPVENVLAFLNNENDPDYQREPFVSETPLSKDLANIYFQYLSSNPCKDVSLLSTIIFKLAESGYRPVLEQHIISYLRQEIEKAKATPHYMSADPVKLVNILDAVGPIPDDVTSLFKIPQKILTDFEPPDEGEKPSIKSCFDTYITYLYLEYLKYTPTPGVAYHFFMSPGIYLKDLAILYFPKKLKNLLIEKLQSNCSEQNALIFLEKLTDQNILCGLNKNDVNVIVEHLCGKDGKLAKSPSFMGRFNIFAFYIVRYWTHNSDLDIGKMPLLYEYWKSIYSNDDWNLQKIATEIYAKSNNAFDIVIACGQLREMIYNDYSKANEIDKLREICKTRRGENKTYMEHLFGVAYFSPYFLQEVKERNNFTQQVSSFISSVVGDKIADE